MTPVTHDKVKEAPRRTVEKPETRRPAPEPDRTATAIRWAAVLIGLAALVAVVVVAVTANDQIEASGEGLVMVESEQMAPRVPADFAPTGWEQPTLGLILMDPEVRVAMVPAGYVPSGWQPPQATLVLTDPDAVRLVLPEGFIPANG